jgi:hypothetical protein
MDEQHTWMSLATLVVFVLIARELMLARQPDLVPSSAGPESKPGQEEEHPLAAPVLAPIVAQVPHPQDSPRNRKRKRR